MTETGALLSSEEETIRSRIHGVREWFLLRGNRLVVAGSVLIAVFGIVVAVRRLGWIPLAHDQPAFYVFSALISGNLTLITVVVSINQLLLSREFELPGELESETQNVIDYRREVANETGEIMPVQPFDFLELLFEGTRREVQRIGGMTYGTVSEQSRTRIDEQIEVLTDHVDEVLAALDDSEKGTFDVLAVTMTTNYAEEINQLYRIRANCGDDLPEPVANALGDLIDALRNVDVARQYFKSLYLQKELSSLSRLLLYTGIPAEVISVLVLLGFTAGQGSAPVHRIELLLPAVVTVAFLPLAILFAFIVRTATVTERTAATIAFTTPSQEQ